MIITPRFYYGCRIVLGAAFLLSIPIGVLVYQIKPNDTFVIGFGLLAAALVIFLFRDIRKYRSLPAGSRFVPIEETEMFRAAAKAGSRVWPGILFGIGVFGVAMLSFDFGGRTSMVILHVLAPMSFVTGLAGLVYPPVVYAARRDVPAPAALRVAAYGLYAIGFLLGCFWAWWDSAR